jgi:hypothetical protein
MKEYGKSDGEAGREVGRMGLAFGLNRTHLRVTPEDSVAQLPGQPHRVHLPEAGKPQRNARPGRRRESGIGSLAKMLLAAVLLADFGEGFALIRQH